MKSRVAGEKGTNVLIYLLVSDKPKDTLRSLFRLLAECGDVGDRFHGKRRSPDLHLTKFQSQPTS
ncbi:hypothetical protein [Anabaena sp. CCY 9910]|uniref:hypothetical protein n=1 Tax=Anabaena sp. CCY 9910 TaxID=3103870 RepID=UPI0039DFEEA9